MVRSFESLPADAVSVAGGKGASLSRMKEAGLPVPPGFVVCASAFDAFLDHGGGGDLISHVTNGLDVDDRVALEAASAQARIAIVSRPLPPALDQAVRRAYHTLGHDVPVAVRSSAVCEDGEAASFAGQQETFLNVRGADAVVQRVKECWASFFSPRALFYRAQKGLPRRSAHSDEGAKAGALGDRRMAVVVQHMVLADKSGVLFTIDPVQRRRDRMIIEAVRGPGDALVSGLITPAHYVVDRDDGSVVDERVPHGHDRVLTGDELNRLRQMGLRLETFFGSPQDVEWCIRGDELLLLQSRPITTL